MPQYTKIGSSYRISYITGPKHILLGLLFSEGSVDHVGITSLGTAGSCNHGVLNEEKIKESVTKGVSEANNSFNTSFIIREIEYVENDTPDYNLYAYCAYLIAKGLHEGIEFEVDKSN